MTSIRENYDSLGVDNYYLNHSNEYSNPHSQSVIDCMEQLYDDKRHLTVLDFACGDGLVSKWIGNRSSIIGCDAFLYERYIQETGNNCLTYSFNDFINFNNNLNYHFDLTVISYALDLCDSSIRPMLLYRLSLISNELLIIRPNKHLIDSPYWTLEKTLHLGKSKASIYVSTIYK